MADDLKGGKEELTRRVEAEVEKFLRRVLLKIQRDAIRVIDEKKLIGYSGQLRKNIRTEIIRETGKIMGLVGVGGNVKYGIIRHEGRRPGKFPPPNEIMKWVVHKGMIRNSRGNSVNTTGKLRRSSDPVASLAKSIAFLIARKIARKGYPGVKFLQIALKQNEPWIKQEIGTITI